MGRVLDGFLNPLLWKITSVQSFSFSRFAFLNPTHKTLRKCFEIHMIINLWNNWRGRDKQNTKYKIIVYQFHVNAVLYVAHVCFNSLVGKQRRKDHFPFSILSLATHIFLFNWRLLCFSNSERCLNEFELLIWIWAFTEIVSRCRFLRET